jgi:hypothetical protein
MKLLRFEVLSRDVPEAAELEKNVASYKPSTSLLD